jgi:serine/threonine protein kinase
MLKASMGTGASVGNGRYVVRGVLGEGAQGTTFDAAGPDGRAVAIKRFDVRGARGWKDVELAERETRVLASLDHPLVPRYIEHFEEDGALYLVMEKIEGETLDAIRQREGALSEDEVRRFLACADRALTYLHGRASPVVHRDVKPRNVIRRPDGTYVLVDFGVVTEMLLRRGSSTVVGTMGYMAPEQFQGRALPATDIYAVGATALAALTGVEPETLPHRGLRIDVRAALAGRAGPAMISSIEHMVEPDPDHRASSLGAALDGIRSESARPPAQSSRPPVALVPAAPTVIDRAEEDAQVRSVKKLLWMLWGLGWILVPMIAGKHYGHPQLIPTIMFGSLAALLVVTWHKGALIRAALRKMSGMSTSAPRHAETQVAESAPGPRIDVGPQVRVHASELRPEELVARTEVQSHEAEPQRQARRR